MKQRRSGLLPLAIAALVAVALLFVSTHAKAHHPMIPPPVVAPPPVIAPPPPVAPPQTAPVATAATGGSFVPWLGIGVTVFSVAIVYLMVCQLEEKRDPEMHKRLACPKTPDWKQCSPFSVAPC